MNQTRRGFLKTMGKLAAIAGVTTVAPTTALTPIETKVIEKVRWVKKVKRIHSHHFHKAYIVSSTATGPSPQEAYFPCDGGRGCGNFQNEQIII